MITDIHSMVDERVVVSSLINRDPKFWADSWSALHEDLFVDARNKLIFRTVAELYSQNIKPEPDSVFSRIQATGSKTVDELYINGLMASRDLRGTLDTHIKPLEDCYKRREAKRVLEQALACMEDRSNDVDGVLNESVNSLVAVCASANKVDVKPIEFYIDGMVDAISKRAAGIDTGCIKTNLIELDKRIDMIEPGDMVVVAGRPSSGKTTFLQYLAIDVLVSQNKPVVVISGEMKGIPITTRLISSMAHLNLGKLRKGELEAHEWQRFTNASLRLKALPITIYDQSSPKLSKIREVLRVAKNKHGSIGAIFVDYLQLCQLDKAGPANDSYETVRISTISTALKDLGMAYNCPIFVLSQLNREAEKRPKKTYQGSDLRGSGQIEQDADVIIFIHREEMYNKADPTLRGQAELIVFKQRNGECGSAFVAADLAHCTFRNKDWGMQDD